MPKTKQPEESTMCYYVCAHQASNDPCPTCQPGETPQPSDWMATYTAPGPEGLSDSTNLD